MAVVNRKRYFEFHLADTEGNPVTGVTLPAFQKYFTRNLAVCSDPLTLLEVGGGLYVVMYTPSAIGHDYLELYHEPTDLYAVMDSEDVEDPITNLGGTLAVTINQDYGSPGALKPTVAHPEEYTLYVFLSADWQVGRTDASFALAATGLKPNGDWSETTLTLLHDIYHFVLFHPNGERLVHASFVQV